MIDCHEATRRLWDYLDGNVEAVDRERLEEHLARCMRCCGELEFAKELRGFMSRSAQGEQVPVPVMDRLTQTLEDLER